ncbi:MAG TPA: hypothetical protein VH253_10460 [Phycisphaerae bacterium]|nr:hypothetical protein [Phycisphaerae bacterium]
MPLASLTPPRRKPLLVATLLLIVTSLATIPEFVCNTLSGHFMGDLSPFTLLHCLSTLSQCAATLALSVAYLFLWAGAPGRPGPFLPFFRILIALYLAILILPDFLDCAIALISSAALLARNVTLYNKLIPSIHYLEDFTTLMALSTDIAGCIYFCVLARILNAPVFLLATLAVFAIDLLYNLLCNALTLSELLWNPNPLNFLYDLTDAYPLLQLLFIAYFSCLGFLLLRRLRPPVLPPRIAIPSPSNP